MNIANDWKDYEILDMANGEKLERWKDVILARPDPQIIWKEKSFPDKWKRINARYHRSKTGGGSWEYNKKMPESWQIKYKNLTFNIKPMGFKHTGLFPEQAVNWDWMIDKIRNEKRDIKVLNLFAYTGGATVACASAGASVCHVDSSKGMVAWAKDNIASSGLEKRPVRYIVFKLPYFSVMLLFHMMVDPLLLHHIYFLFLFLYLQISLHHQLCI